MKKVLLGLGLIGAFLTYAEGILSHGFNIVEATSRGGAVTGLGIISGLCFVAASICHVGELLTQGDNQQSEA